MKTELPLVITQRCHFGFGEILIPISNNVFPIGGAGAVLGEHTCMCVNLGCANKPGVALGCIVDYGNGVVNCGKERLPLQDLCVR